ncbi:hypothetical protein [Vibrio sp. HN007]|uniref:hypothetical protein n=1 Tax=Vibrio iocasae TaxID=3098914 RepID=UPI0035D3E3F3
MGISINMCNEEGASLNFSFYRFEIFRDFLSAIDYEFDLSLQSLFIDADGEVSSQRCAEVYSEVALKLESIRSYSFRDYAEFYPANKFDEVDEFLESLDYTRAREFLIFFSLRRSELRGLISLLELAAEKGRGIKYG